MRTILDGFVGAELYTASASVQHWSCHLVWKGIEPGIFPRKSHAMT
jgi:hypothetical protein